MVRSRTPFPSEGDFIIGRVKEIQRQYVYVDLIDYEGLESEETATGMIHVSEISSSWIKNIRNFVRLNQIIVCRVLRVDEHKGHIDLSIRRVNSAQRKNRMKEHKYATKFENLLQFLCDEKNITLDEAYEMIGWPLLEMYGDEYQDTVEELKEHGKELMSRLKNVSEDIKKAFIKIVDDNVKISTVSIVGKLKIILTNSNGIEIIKDALISAKKVIPNPKETRKISISYLGAPFYRLEIVTKDYVDAENLLSEALEIVEEKIKEHNGTFEFIRD
ncbi:MAG: translation initiation factor IF-2 subunit alpha [Promethearchaeota archaeon]